MSTRTNVHTSNDRDDVIALSTIADRLGVTFPHQVDQVADYLVHIRQLAILLEEKMSRLVRALDTPNAEYALYEVRQLADKAGYSNTVSANLADLLVECARVDAAVAAWVRQFHAAAQVTT